MGVAALAASVVLLVGGVVAVRALRAEPERSATAVSLADRSYEAGQCLTWDQDEDGPESNRAETVPCSEEHLREVIGVIELDDVRGDFPSDEEWVRLKDRCDPIVERHLGRYVNSLLHPIGQATIKPSASTWADGDRQLVCELGLRQVDLAAKRARVRVSFRGRVRAIDLLSPFEAGDCIRWTDDDVGTVPCAEPHHYEVTGIVALDDSATGDVPTVWEAMQVGRERCPSELEEHLDGTVPPGVTDTLIPMDQEDLDGGVRGLVCLAVRFLGDEPIELVGPLGS